MLRSPMPKTTYLIKNALGYSAEGVFVSLIIYCITIVVLAIKHIVFPRKI